MPKKVLMMGSDVHPVPPLKGAAVEMWMVEVSMRLFCYEPHIVSISHPSYPLEEYKDGIFFHRIHLSRLYKRLFQKITNLDPLSYPKRVCKIIDEIKPDILHMHNSLRAFIPLLSALQGRGPKTVLHLQNEFRLDTRLQVDAFVGCSRHIMDFYQEKPIQATHRVCIYNGVDLDKFRPYRQDLSARESLRRKFGIREEDFIVLYIGRVSPEKGVEHLIRCALLLKDRKNIRFFVVGEIQKGDPASDRVKYGQEMVKMAAPLGNKMTFTDVFPPSKIHLIYRIGDVFVLPSNFDDPFPFVALEAMASGLPLIARKKGGLTDYIVDGVNGLFIGEDSPAEDMADKILRLLSDANRRESLSRAGRKTIEERFSWEKIVSDVEELYSLLLSNHS